jgi:hypothetical protein
MQPNLWKMLAKLAAEGRHVEREAVAWQLADCIMRGPQGFNPGQQPRRIDTSCACEETRVWTCGLNARM